MAYKNSAFQQAIDAVEALPIEDQEMLLDVLHKRFTRHRQKVLAQEIAEVRQEYARGNVQFGTVTDSLAELDD
jgi:hypothetical protein